MKLLTVKECAKILNVSLGLAYRIVSSGDLPSVRIASAIRVREADLEAYVDSCSNHIHSEITDRVISLRRLKC